MTEKTDEAIARAACPFPRLCLCVVEVHGDCIYRARRQRAALQAAGFAVVPWELLKPFAEAEECLDPRDRDSAPIWENPAAMTITVGDLRRLAASTPQPETQRHD